MGTPTDVKIKAANVSADSVAGSRRELEYDWAGIEFG